jgi:heme-degrading monooxygenase HmoA
MVVEYIRYKIDSNRAEGFVAAIKLASEIVKKDPNYIDIELTQCEEDPSLFTWRIIWTSIDGHLNGFRKSAVFSSFFSIVKPYFADIQEMQHYKKLL